jgi:TP901 family phage tail tape measure protein
MPGQLDLGDLVARLGFSNEEEFIRELNAVFTKAEGEAKKGGQKAGAGFSQDFARELKAGLGANVTGGAFLGTVLANAFTGAVSAAKQFAGESVDEFRRYSAGLVQLKIAGETNIPAVEKQLLALSESSQVFNQTDFSSAVGQLIQSGLSASESLKLVKASSDLAASGLDPVTGKFANLGETATQVGAVIRALGLGFDQSARAVDVLALAAQKSGTNVQGLVSGVAEVGGVAQTTGIPLEQLSASIAYLTNTGRGAAESATGLRTVISALLSPTGTLKKQADALGLSLVDAKGNTRDFLEVLKNVGRVAEEGGRGAQFLKNVGLDTYALTTALALGKGADKVREFTTELQNASGAAKTLADVTRDGPVGQLEALQKRADNAKVTLGEKLVPLMVTLYERVLPNLTDALSQAVTWFDRLTGAAFNAAKSLGDYQKTYQTTLNQSQQEEVKKILADLDEIKRRRDAINDTLKNPLTQFAPNGVNALRGQLKDLDEQYARLLKRLTDIQKLAQSNPKPAKPLEVPGVPFLPDVKTGTPDLSGSSGSTKTTSAEINAALPKARELAVALANAREAGKGIAEVELRIKTFENSTKGATDALRIATEELKKQTEQTKKLAAARAEIARTENDATFAETLRTANVVTLEAIVATEKRAQADAKARSDADAYKQASDRLRQSTTALKDAQAEALRVQNELNQARGEAVAREAALDAEVKRVQDAAVKAGDAAVAKIKAAQIGLKLVDEIAAAFETDDPIKIQTLLERVNRFISREEFKSLPESLQRSITSAIPGMQEVLNNAKLHVDVDLEPIYASITAGTVEGVLKAAQNALDDLSEADLNTVSTRPLEVIRDRLKDALKQENLTPGKQQELQKALDDIESRISSIADTRSTAAQNAAREAALDLEVTAQQNAAIEGGNAALEKQNQLRLDGLEIAGQASRDDSLNLGAVINPALFEELTALAQTDINDIDAVRAGLKRLTEIAGDPNFGAVAVEWAKEIVPAFQAVIDVTDQLAAQVAQAAQDVDLEPVYSQIAADTATGTAKAVDAALNALTFIPADQIDLGSLEKLMERVKADLSLEGLDLDSQKKLQAALKKLEDQIANIKKELGLLPTSAPSSLGINPDGTSSVPDVPKDANGNPLALPAPTIPAITNDNANAFTDAQKEVDKLEGQLENLAIGFGKDLIDGVRTGDIGGALEKILGSASDFFIGELLKGIIAEQLAASIASSVASSAAGNAAGGVAGAAGGLAALGPAGLAIGAIALLGSFILPGILSNAKTPEYKSSLGDKRDSSSPAIQYTAIANTTFAVGGTFDDPAFRAARRAETLELSRGLLEQLGLIDKDGRKI